MDPVNVIRAPSLKRGKADERLSDRVSNTIVITYYFIIMQHDPDIHLTMLFLSCFFFLPMENKRNK